MRALLSLEIRDIDRKTNKEKIIKKLLIAPLITKIELKL